MFPVNSFVIASEPLSKAAVDSITHRDLAVCDQNFVLEYFRLSANKHLLFGGRCNYFGDEPQIIKNKLLPRMLKIYPQLQNKKIDYAWGGTIGVPINRVPQIGRISLLNIIRPGLFRAWGQCHAFDRTDNSRCNRRHTRAFRSFCKNKTHCNPESAHFQQAHGRTWHALLSTQGSFTERRNSCEHIM